METVARTGADPLPCAVPPGEPAGPRLVRRPVFWAVVTALYVLAFLAGRLLQNDAGVSLWFPPAAVVLSALVLAGPAAAPGLWLLRVLTPVLVLRPADFPWPRVLVTSVLVIGAYTLAAQLIRRRAPGLTLERMSDVRTLSWGTAVGALGAAAGWMLWGLLDGAPPTEVLGVAADFAIGDAAAVLTLAPLLLYAGGRCWTGRPGPEHLGAIPTLLLVAAAGGIGTAVMLAARFDQGMLGLILLLAAAVVAAQRPVLAIWALACVGGTIALIVASTPSTPKGTVDAQLLVIALAVIMLGLTAVIASLRRERVTAQDREQEHGLVVSALVEGVVVLDADRQVVSMNPAARRLLELEGDPQTLEQLSERGYVDQTGAPMAIDDLPVNQIFVTGHERTGAIVGSRRRDGTPIWFSVNTRALEGSGGSRRALATFTDVTEQVLADSDAQADLSQLRHRALHDTLTGLPNRTLLLDRLARAGDVATRSRMTCALLVLDLDGFKQINDDMGHAAGDEVLVQVGVRLRTLLRPSDTAARMGGDEFVVLVEGLHPAEAATETAAIAARIDEVLGAPYITTAGQAETGASVGWALAHPGTPVSLDLLAAADVAMLERKQARRLNARPQPATAAAAPTHELSVLIVDDDPAMRLLARRILEGSGTGLFVVGEAIDGAAAVEQTAALSPDLVLLDVMMPGLSGPDAVQAIVQHRPGQAIVFWSAQSQRHDTDLGIPYVGKEQIENLPSALLDAYAEQQPDAARLPGSPLVNR